ncbi:MAG TPA: AsmA family protein [Thermoanaerobaculia bacterium]|jgi:hypothetical protein
MNDYKPPFDEVTREREVRDLELRDGEVPEIEVPEAKSPDGKSPNARRVLRILAIVAAVFAALLILLIVALPFVVSFEAVRGRVLAAAESALHRKVAAGRIRLRIFPLGAGVDNVTVLNRPGFATPTLFSADHVSIRLAFWPLLARRADVRKVVLEGASLTVERDPKGALNVADFLAASVRPSKGAQPATSAATLISNVEITRGRLQIVDRKRVPGETVTTTLDAIEGAILGISASSPARFDFDGRLLADGPPNVTLKGTFGPPKPGRPLGESVLAASLSAKSLALAKLGSYLGAKQEADPGVLSLDATANGAFLGALKLAGNLTLVPREGGGPLPALDGQLTGVLDWPHGALTLEQSPITIARIPLMVQGRVDGLRKAPRVDWKLATPGEVAIDGVSGLPDAAGTLPADFKISGRVRLTAEVAGSMEDRTRHASLAAVPLEVSQGGQSILAAPTATVTLESRVGAPSTGRLSIPAGKLKGAAFQGLLADWSLEKGVLTLSRADAAAPPVSADLSEARGQVLVDALTRLLQDFLTPVGSSPASPASGPASR